MQHYDQLGRVRLSRTLENPATEDPEVETDGIKVQTRYATNSGYTYQLTSNPYRATTSSGASGEATMGWTRSKVANTGRHSEVETFTGATLPQPFLTTGYNTASTGMVSTDKDADRAIVSDQTGKRRISKTNSLGQITDIWEIVGASDAWTTSVTFPGSAYSGVAYGYQTSYQYDTLNNLTLVDQGDQDNREFSYSSISRLLTAENPESGTISYGYDSNGNLTSKVDARSITAAYTYDALNRVTVRGYTNEPSGSETPDVTYTYDNVANAKGKLTKVSSSISTTEYAAFDIIGRVTAHEQTTDSNDYTTAYAYNLSDAMTEETYPSGRKVRNVLDIEGDLAQVQSQENSSDIFRNYASSFVYTAAGALSSMKLGNGKFENTQFNSRLQPTQIGLGASASTQNLLKLNYNYGSTANNGNVLTQTITVKRPSQSDLVFDQTYTYDSLNRLQVTEEKTGTTTNWKQTFTFDRYGNRNFNQSQTTQPASFANPSATDPTVNTSNNRFASGQGFVYDAAGNVTTDAEGRTFTYDAENKQIEAKNASNATLGTYYFDGDGKRVKKVMPSTGETTIFVYDAGGKLVAEYSTIVQSSENAKVQYLTNDNLGTPRINTDRDGNVISRSDYMPYGEEIVAVGGRSSTDKYVADDVRQGFTGYINDGETGLDFAQARMYSKDLGRFTATDPMMYSARIENAQTWNRYTYVLNNPLKLIDPSGMFEWGTSLGGPASDDELDKTKVGKKIREKRQEIIGKLNTLKGLTAEAAKKAGLTSEQFSKIQRAVNAYGNPNDKNGVSLEVGGTSEGVAVTSSGKDGFFNISLSSDQKITSITANVVVTFNNLDLDTIVHEGDHVAGRQALAAEYFKEVTTGNSDYDPEKSQFNLLKYERENSAYQTESAYVQLSGGESQIWKKGWSEAKRQTEINNKISSGYKDSKGKGITSSNPGDRLFRYQK